MIARVISNRAFPVLRLLPFVEHPLDFFRNLSRVPSVELVDLVVPHVGDRRALRDAPTHLPAHTGGGREHLMAPGVPYRHGAVVRKSAEGRRSTVQQIVHAGAAILRVATQLGVPLPNRHRDDTGADSRIDIRRHRDRTVRRRNLHHVAIHDPVFFSRFRADLNPRTPRDLGDWIGKLLEPSPIGRTPVVKDRRRIGHQRQLAGRSTTLPHVERQLPHAAIQASGSRAWSLVHSSSLK